MYGPKHKTYGPTQKDERVLRDRSDTVTRYCTEIMGGQMGQDRSDPDTGIWYRYCTYLHAVILHLRMQPVCVGYRRGNGCNRRVTDMTNGHTLSGHQRAAQCGHECSEGTHCHVYVTQCVL